MRFTNLQLGRFVAAAAVLVFHAAYHGHTYLGLETALIEPVPAYWFRTAILFFFALSGFVLAHGLQTATLGTFLRFRLLRLYPAYWAVAAVVLVVRGLNGTQIPFDHRGLWHAVLLWPAGPNRSAYSIGVEWTLVYEVLLSLALIPFAAVGRRWGLGVGSAVWLGWIGWNLLKTNGQVFQPFPKLAEFPASVINAAFLFGVLAYLGRDRLPRLRFLLPVLAAGALWVGSHFAVSAVGWSVLLQAVGTVAALGWFVVVPQLAPGRLLVRAGDWSYGIYLVHVPAMLAVFALAGGQASPLAVAMLGGVVALAAGSLYGAAEWQAYRRFRTAAVARPAPPLPVAPVPARRAA